MTDSPTTIPGRGYTPGNIYATPTDKNQAALSLDWFEFGRARGSTMLWTEDWFPDSMAQQWSYYTSRFRAAARLAPTATAAHPQPAYGGYVVPRASTGGGQSPTEPLDPLEADGILMKIISIIGGGGKCSPRASLSPSADFHLSMRNNSYDRLYIFERVQWRRALNDRLARGQASPSATSSSGRSTPSR